MSVSRLICRDARYVARMQRTLLGAAGAVTLALVLAACGDSGDSNTDGTAAGKECTPTATLTVGALDKLSFDAASYEADAGCLEITYENEGSVAHTLLVRSQKGFKLSVGDVDKGTIDLAAGDYEIYCDVAGHEAAGMVADLTLS